MQINTNTFIWSILNFASLFLIIYLVYRVTRNVGRNFRQRRENEATIIKKMDEVIDLNKQLIGELSKNRSN